MYSMPDIIVYEWLDYDGIISVPTFIDVVGSKLVIAQYNTP